MQRVNSKAPTPNMKTPKPEKKLPQFEINSRVPRPRVAGGIARGGMGSKNVNPTYNTY